MISPGMGARTSSSAAAPETGAALIASDSVAGQVGSVVAAGIILAIFAN